MIAAALAGVANAIDRIDQGLLVQLLDAGADRRHGQQRGELVFALPVIQTFSYANYAEAWNANSTANMLLIVFVLWSCWTSYCAATTVFTLRKGSARFWFLILPLVFYVLALGVIGVIYSLIH